MSRLVVVSNRVKGDAGGLAVGVEAALAQTGGLWFGWSGTTGEAGSDMVKVTRDGPVTYALMNLPKADLDAYYTGFANGSLWPLLHNRIDLVAFSHKDFAGYLRVNRRFAAELRPMLGPDDLIWVHDYHLIPLAAQLRALGVNNPIGYFLHVPWPPPDILFVLPAYRELLKGLAAYDLIGFQTENDVENFEECLVREGLARRVDSQLLDPYGRRFNIGAFPIGIETATFAEIASRTMRHPVVQRTRESLIGRKLIIGVDRLDYSKGLNERIEAYAQFLDTNPAMRRQVTYLQVTPKSRSDVPGYAAIQRSIAELTGRINGAYGDVDWTPVRYVNRPIGRPALAGLYRASQVGLVTPLRDGMNLVAKEYVASQDPADPGVLILSRFAGAARELDGALLVNPYDTEETASAIAQALSMPLPERLNRWRGMFARILRNDINHWRERYLARLAALQTVNQASSA